MLGLCLPLITLKSITSQYVVPQLDGLKRQQIGRSFLPGRPTETICARTKELIKSHRDHFFRRKARDFHRTEKL